MKCPSSRARNKFSISRISLSSSSLCFKSRSELKKPDESQRKPKIVGQDLQLGAIKFRKLRYYKSINVVVELFMIFSILFPSNQIKIDFVEITYQPKCIFGHSFEYISKKVTPLSYVKQNKRAFKTLKKYYEMQCHKKCQNSQCS